MTETTAVPAPLARAAYDALAAAASLARDVLIAHDAWELHYEGAWQEIAENGVHAWWTAARDGGSTLGADVAEWVAVARQRLAEAALSRSEPQTMQARGVSAIRRRISDHYLRIHPRPFAEAVAEATEEALAGARSMGRDDLAEAIRASYLAAGVAMMAEAEVRAEAHRAVTAARDRNGRKG